MFQPFRTHSFGIAEPKTIHETGEQGSKFLQASSQSELSEVVRVQVIIEKRFQAPPQAKKQELYRCLAAYHHPTTTHINFS